MEIPFWAQLGIGALAVALLLLGHRRIWVFGWQYTEVEQDRDFWRDLYLRTYQITDAAVTTIADDRRA